MSIAKNLLIRLQRKYQKGGYALVAPKSGKVLAHGQDLPRLYKVIEKKHVNDKDKLVMYIPTPGYTHVFRLSLSIRTGR